MNDIVIKNGHILSMDPHIGDISRGDIHVQGGRIIGIMEHIDVPGAEVIDATDCIVTPGFVDGHRHAWLSLMRADASEVSLPEFMVEGRAMYCGCFDAESAYVANYLGGLESINAGITSIVDHSHLQKSPEVSDALAEGLLDSGVGGYFCYALQNIPDYLDGRPVDEKAVAELLTRPADSWHYENAARVRDKYFQNHAGPLRFGVALFEATAYVPSAMSIDLFERARALAPALITSHWNAISKPGMYISSLSDLHAAGSFSSPTVLSHSNQLNDDDLSLMAKANIGLCTCPDIECGMGLGPLLAPRLVALGGAASLGLDLTSYVEANLLRQAYLLLQMERKTLAEQAGAMPHHVALTARRALELLTLTGARSIGLEKEVGSLTPGKRADALIIKPNTSRFTRSTDPATTLLFYTNVEDIDTVLLGGRVRKRGGRLEGIDSLALQERVNRAFGQVQERFDRLPREKFQRVWSSMF